jgi:hypothetical protein
MKKLNKYEDHSTQPPHILWTGPMKYLKEGTYGRFYYTDLNGVYKDMTAHRAMYMFKSNLYELDPHMHVSHICHVKKCVSFFHLSYEPACINNARIQCLNNKVCNGHPGYPDCIFVP